MMLASRPRKARRQCGELARSCGATCSKTRKFCKVAPQGCASYIHRAMASIRENVRNGAALFACIASGCVATDEPLFSEFAAPEPRIEVEQGAGSAPAELPVVQPSTEPVTELLPLSPPPGAAAPPLSMAPLPPAAPPVLEPPATSVLPSPCPTEGLLLCESFEQSASGEFPGEPWLPELSGCGTHRVESVASEGGQSRSGMNALSTARGGYPECMLHAELEEEPELYLRTWVRLGAEPALREQYLTLLELGPEEDEDEPELRIGLRPPGGSLCGASPGLDVSVSGLQGSGPTTGCSGVQLEPERWHCLQAHVVRDGRRLSYELALDGIQVLSSTELRLGAAWDDELYFKVGRAAYGVSPAGSLWHDDVAVSRSPLPCTAP